MIRTTRWRSGAPRATASEYWEVNGFLMRGKEEGLQALSSCRVFLQSTALQNVLLMMPPLLVIKFCVGSELKCPESCLHLVRVPGAYVIEYRKIPEEAEKEAFLSCMRV